LAEKLRWKAEHIQPTDDRSWVEMDEDERAYYRNLVEWILLHDELVREALGEPS
jgi:ribonucleotide reductase beta subunit family protein with ferritin-like domain